MSDDEPAPVRADAIGVLLPRDLTASRVLAYARRAEALGFDELWTVQDLGYRGGIAQTAAVLAATTRIRVGVGLLPTGARNAAYAAMELATLAELFPGRLDIALGHGMPGWMRQVGAWPASPLTLFEEYVAAIRALLAGKVVTTTETNRYVRLDGVRLDPGVVPSVSPRLLGGMRGPKSLALGGRVTDGTVLAEPVTPEYIRIARERIGANGPHRLVGYNVAAVRDDDTAALDAVRPALAWIGDPEWAPHIEPLPFAADFASLRERAADRDAFTRDLPGDWVQQLSIAGTSTTARARVDELFAAGLDSCVLIPADPDAEAELDSLARLLRGSPRPSPTAPSMRPDAL